MRLTCPSCGAVASLEAWTNDERMRWCLSLIAEMPGSIAVNVPQYLGLFRDPDSQRGLSWARVKNLLTQLKDLVEAQEIQWKRKVPRPNNPRAWGMAMERLIQNPPQRLPLTSHGYLKAMAYEIADQLHAVDERRHEEERRYPYYRPCTQAQPGEVEQQATGSSADPGSHVTTASAPEDAPRRIPPEIQEALDRIKRKANLNGGL